MLWEEMEKYTELTGEDATHVPIMKIGAYLDGYEKGTEVLDKIKVEIANHLKTMTICDVEKDNGVIVQSELTNIKVVLYDTVLQIIDKYKAEGSGE